MNGDTVKVGYYGLWIIWKPLYYGLDPESRSHLHWNSVKFPSLLWTGKPG